MYKTQFDIEMPDQDQYFNTISSKLPSFNIPTEMGSLQSLPDSNLQSSYAALFDKARGQIQAGGSEGAIASYLSPIINQAQQQQRQELTAKIKPYIGEVKQLTDRTFPDLFSGSGLGSLGSLFGQPFGGGEVQFLGDEIGGGMVGTSVADVSPVANILQKPIYSPYTLGIK